MHGKRGNPGLKGQLLEKSIEAYIGALDCINSLHRKYRVESFAFLLCNAWELLLKARILDQSGDRKSIYYEMKPRPRSHSLRVCIRTCWPDETDPTRRNLEFIEALRDEATHLVIARVPPSVMGLFQAGVLNYHHALGEWFGVSLSDRVPLGLMSLVYDLSPTAFDFKDQSLRRQMGRETFDYLAELQGQIMQEWERGGKAAQFSLGLDYSLALVKKPGESDIVLAPGASGEVARIVKVAKDPSETHPLLCKDVVKQLHPILGRNEKDKPVSNAYLIGCVVKGHNIQARDDFFYHGTIQGAPKQYSQAFVDWMLAQHAKNPGFFEAAKQGAKAAKSAA